MYNDVGKKIKGIVDVVTKLSITIWVIVGIIFIIGGFGSGVFVIVVLGIVGTPLMCLLSWLSGLVVYALGDITDNLQEIRNKIVGAEEEIEYTAKTQKRVLSEDELLAEGAWECSSCKTKNPLKRQYCIKCGTNRDWSEEKSKK